MGDTLYSNGPTAQKLLKLLGVDIKDCKKVTITFAAGEPVIVETKRMIGVKDTGNFDEVLTRKCKLVEVDG